MAETTNIFEQATRKALRISTNKGQLSAEQLWKLSLKDLDELAIALEEEAGKSKKSFIKKSTPADTLAQLSFDVVKHIIDVKLEEQETAKTASEKAAKNQRLREILLRKQDEKLESLSEEEIQKLLAD